ncbi:MAG TPA: PQQ-binding-like beta-propeller repeat protein [Gemmatimonadales bacterium]|nr:PQQ-binding-like beta-propeller repeat protein [Gemmatimonadales bacterium]
MAGLFSVNAIVSGCAPVVKTGPARQETSWLAYLGTQRHDAAAQEMLNPDPRPLWHIGVGRGVRGSPALGESIIAVGSADRYLTLIDRSSGDVLWRTRLDGTVRSGPLLDADRLYIATEAQPEGRVYAVRLRDGKTLWKTRIGSVAAPLTFDGDALYAGTEEGVVFRLDPEHGNVTWHRALHGAVRAGPVATPQGLVVTTTTDTLFLLDRETGIVHGHLPLPGAVLATPATDGRRVYLATTNGTVIAVSLAPLSIQWDFPAGDAVYGAPALVADTLYVLSRDGQLWIIPTEAVHNAMNVSLDIVATAGPTPIESGGGILVGSVSGEILLIDRESGAIKWRTQIAGPIEEPPLVRDRQLVVVAGRGNIHTYR